MTKPDPNQPQLVPETVLKRKHDMDEMKAHRAAQELSNPRGNRKIFAPKTKTTKIYKPESFISNARAMRNREIRYARVMRKGMQKRASNKKIVEKKKVSSKLDSGATSDDEDDDSAEKVEIDVATNSVDAPMIFAIRIRDNVAVPQRMRKILSSFRLRNKNEGVFIKYTKGARKRLHLIEPFVSYGILTKGTITDLIHRRGHGKVEGKRVPLSDNTVIEKAIGDESGIICVEDLVHELHNVGPHFKQAAAFLWPFRLTAVKSKYQSKTLRYNEGGDYGDRGEAMDALMKLVM